MKPWVILCDFDGTISVEDVTDALLERYGEPGWEDLEEDWRRGRISSRVCMQQQIGMLRATAAELDAEAESFRIDPDFPAFVAAVRAANGQIAVVSDGLDRLIRAILARHGLEDLPVFANHLSQVGPDRWQLESPCADKTCRVDAGTCKCARAQQAHAAGQPVMLVGDGASDFCVAHQADLVFAKHRLIEHCRTHGLNHFPIVGFGDAIGLLTALERGLDEFDHAAAPDKELESNE